MPSSTSTNPSWRPSTPIAQGTRRLVHAPGDRQVPGRTRGHRPALELGLADGLADPNVIVLDPCCGTGAYWWKCSGGSPKTLQDKGGEALIANDLKKAAMERVFGFEILPAPFVVAHLQLGLILQNFGAPSSESCNAERAGVYLTNALTGWEPPKEKPKPIGYPDWTTNGMQPAK